MYPVQYENKGDVVRFLLKSMKPPPFKNHWYYSKLECVCVAWTGIRGQLSKMALSTSKVSSEIIDDDDDLYD